MEAGTLGRGGPAPLVAISEAVRARSRAFWIVAGLTALAALLRFVTLGVQSYHHDEIVTANRILDGGFAHAMDAVGFSESTPPLYYALAWVWVQATGTGEFGLRSLSAVAGVATVPVVYLLAAELRGRRAGLMAAALAAVNPMLLWYSQEARAYAVLTLLCAVSLLYCARAARYGRRRDLTGWGIASALALATHYFAIFLLAGEVAVLVRRRRREVLRGLWILALGGLLLAPLAVYQASLGHAEWIMNMPLGHRVWDTAATFVTGETDDIIGQPERPALAFVPLALCLAAFALLAWRGDRDEKRAAALPLLAGGGAFALPVALALIAPGKDYVLARNLMPALVPLLVLVAIAVTVRGARRLGTALGAGLVVYSLGFCVLASVSPTFQRPDWGAVVERFGEPEQPRATVTWVLGRTPLQYYLSSSAFQAKPSDGYRWRVHEIDLVSQGPVPPPGRQALGPRFREVGTESVGPLFIRRYRVPGPGLAPLRMRRLRDSRLNFRTNGVLLEGIGPG